MAIIAEISIEGDEFLLGQIIAEHPGLSVEIERVVPADNRIMPYIWGYGTDLKAFEVAMNESPNVRSIAVLDEYEDRALYKIEWEDPAEQLIAGITETDATILEAHSDEEWLFRIRFEDHSGLAQFNTYCRTHDINYRLSRVSSMDEMESGERDYGLTEAQYEALSLAVERGYFKVPRDVEYDELAAELDVSVQALSERIRRGADKVLQDVFRQRNSRNSRN
ncbi:helix-turn-helix domain-containing protein [Natronorubrum sp. FCH18a]|uniref:helix-turn-helix domain-containing protein n=1 Tax=Natronorubrum sp. FCH18a TaxID=3447018 RepID=UPI003F5147FA